MTDEIDPYTVALNLDLSGFHSELKTAETTAKNFGKAMDSALVGSIVRGKSFSDVLRTMVMQLSALTLKSSFAPLTQGLGDLASGALSSILPFAKGGVVAPSLTHFANGGVVGAPTFFPMQGGNVGLMGERGAEAILPLSRGANGALGVATHGAGQANITVHMNITTPDPQSFKASRNDLAASLSRAITRANRAL